MFNRGSGGANPFGARPDQDRQQRPAQNFSRPQQGSGYDTQMGYDGRSPPPQVQRTPVGRPAPQQRPPVNTRAMALRPVKSPGGNSFAFGNL